MTKSIFLGVALMIFSFLTAHAMENVEYDGLLLTWREKHKDNVNLEAEKNTNKVKQIVDSSLKTLELLNSWPQNKPVPKDLLKGAGNAIGQFCYFSPYTLPLLDCIIFPYLQKGLLNYNDLKAPHYSFKFGELCSRTTVDPNLSKQMVNGQWLTSHHHLNYPLFFNRLLIAFDGDFLLLGGGEKCECNHAQSRHPRDSFYCVDIDNRHAPDVVMHGGYLNHLYFFPTERFSFIWFEHYTPVEFLTDIRVVEQYFRMAKPGCIFLFQSNFISPHLQLSDEDGNTVTHKEHTRKIFTFFAGRLLSYKFSLLENEILETLHHGEMKSFVQVIVMKPFQNFAGQVLESAQGPIMQLNEQTLINFRKANEREEEHALFCTKCMSSQVQLKLAFPPEELAHSQEGTENQGTN